MFGRVYATLLESAPITPLTSNQILSIIWFARDYRLYITQVLGNLKAPAYPRWMRGAGAV